jgi:hypothetical protein
MPLCVIDIPLFTSIRGMSIGVNILRKLAQINGGLGDLFVVGRGHGSVPWGGILNLGWSWANTLKVRDPDTSTQATPVRCHDGASSMALGQHTDDERGPDTSE